MSDAQRAYPHEQEELQTISESILQVWGNNDGALKKASDEIKFSRYWLARMEKDRRSAAEALGRSLKRESTLNGLINEILERGRSRALSPDDLIEKINGVINGPLPD